MKKVCLSTLKYLLIFLLIYGVVNWWRAPTMPTQAQLSYTNHLNQTTDVITQSHQAPVLVYFWGTWCGICRLTTPNVQQLHEQGVPVISVATKSDSTEALADYLQQHRYTFTTINDLDGSVFADWQGSVTPSFVILEDGQVKQRFTGIAPLWSLKLRLWLATIL